MIDILVTGGAGYIGSHFCKALNEKKIKPVIFDDISTGNEGRVKWGKLEKGSILNIERLREVFKKYEPKVVVHFAALISVNESVSSPDRYYSNNIVGSLNLLNVMNEFKVSKLIFSSSAAVYGIAKEAIVSESSETHPINPYGRTKLIFEEILKDYDKAYGLKSISFRYFNAAGASFDKDIGPDTRIPAHLIPRVINVALGRTPELEIFGTDYSTEDGTCIRDYIHVLDLASAHLMGLDYLQKNGDSFICNLGLGRGYSVREVVSAVESITGKHVRIKETVKRAGDPPKLIADARKAQELLGWKAKYSDLTTIIETLYGWMRKN